MKKHHIIFAALTILIMWGMLAPGYIFSLDMIPPQVYTTHFESSGAPFYTLLAITNLFLPSQIIQKLLIFLVIFLSLTTMYDLIPAKSATPKYYAALLYAINPFVLDRFLAGHINLLLAYAITPLAVKYILRFKEDPKKYTTSAALIIAATGILNLHNLFITLTIFIAIMITNPKKTSIIPAIKVIAIILLLNSYWLLQEPTEKISTITEDDIAVFRSRPALSFNTAFTLAGMHGFWRTTSSPPSYWPILFIIILFLAVHGYVRTKDHAFALIWLASLIIAIGITSPYTEPIYRYLYENIFFFKGFREPQKFIGLAALAYAYLGAKGIESIKKNYILLIIPLIYTTGMFTLSAALPSQDYPEDYYEMDAYLNSDKQDFNTLVLPWHQYMDYSWNKNKDKRLANVARSFFQKPTITGDNMETGRIYSSSNNPRSEYIEQTLKENTTSIGKSLARINVKYVMLKKEVDYQKYQEFLQNQTDLTLIKNTTNLLLYVNNNPTYIIYQTDGDDITPLSYEKISDTHYFIEEPEKKYVVLTDTYDNSWTLGQSKKQQSQPTNIWEYSKDRELKKTTSYTGYIISIITFIIIMAKDKKI
ncbi:MAG: hypothetical protein ABIG84_04040 [archaeon]